LFLSTSADASISSGIHLNLINEFTDILLMSWMQSGDIWPEDWIREFMGRTRTGWFIPREFDEMKREMEREVEEQFRDIQATAPKELVREYETPEGDKVREIGPLVYGYSMIIGQDGKPRVREFGNVQPSRPGVGRGVTRPRIIRERVPLANVITTHKEVIVEVEMPGINKKDIRVNASKDSVEVISEDPERKYRRVIDLPPETSIETAMSTYKNGMLEIVFDKKKQSKPKGKQINLE
jgi:HSP20 family protein